MVVQKLSNALDAAVAHGFGHLLLAPFVILILLLSLYLKPQKSKSAIKDEKSRDELFLDEIVPYKGLPIYHRPEWPRYWKAGKFQMTMALRKLDPNNWMTFDDQWQVEHEAKLRYAARPDRETILDYLDGEDEAAIELLELVVEYVTRRFPDMFQREGDCIVIIPTNERYRVKAPYDRHPLETAGLLVMDDLYILKLGPRDLYYLRGAFLAAPTGWRMDQRIGWPLHQIHDAVPLWKEKLKKSMEKFFFNLKVDAPIQRNNLFIQPTGGIFHHDRFEDYPEVQDAKDIWIRSELQSLRRLPRSKAIVFSVRTYLTNMTELREEPAALERLWDSVLNYPDIVGHFKVTRLWKKAFEAFCRETLGKDAPEIDPETGDGVGKAAKPKTCPAGFT